MDRAVSQMEKTATVNIKGKNMQICFLYVKELPTPSKQSTEHCTCIFQNVYGGALIENATNLA
jgi:hypothetical protein